MIAAASLLPIRAAIPDHDGIPSRRTKYQ
jgi:Phage integrase family